LNSWSLTRSPTAGKWQENQGIGDSRKGTASDFGAIICVWVIFIPSDIKYWI